MHCPENIQIRRRLGSAPDEEQAHYKNQCFHGYKRPASGEGSLRLIDAAAMSKRGCGLPCRLQQVAAAQPASTVDLIS